ncbi:zf-HC2 domain-containing protein [Facklamia miroungae]|uniref:Anti-sigma-W factor RsiW n=1 Tax=Facklamia miroungae TaxID=120956 RepID=A0A1G7Q893_9LACT|nr:zf-HC2 domain-containing protein [Facklamia miroungae]NKZ28856.1 hypothetical protein [Facklamia miroungae]SDF94752.1 Putative zinc-finger [Facklamia miroungae]
MKYDCDLIVDLLPLYVEGVLSQTSNEIVEEHLRECEDCIELLEELKKDNSLRLKEKESYETHVKEYTERVKKRKRIIRLALGALFFVCIGAASIMTYFATHDPFEYIATDIATYQEAKEYIKEGKVPKIMPETAEHISIIYQTEGKKLNGKFHVNAQDMKKMQSGLKKATVDHLRMATEAIDGNYNEVKKTLEKEPEGVRYYQDDRFVYVFIPDGTIYYFLK